MKPTCTNYLLGTLSRFQRMNISHKISLLQPLIPMWAIQLLFFLLKFYEITLYDKLIIQKYDILYLNSINTQMRLFYTLLEINCVYDKSIELRFVFDLNFTKSHCVYDKLILQNSINFNLLLLFLLNFYLETHYVYDKLILLTIGVRALNSNNINIIFRSCLREIFLKSFSTIHFIEFIHFLIF